MMDTKMKPLGMARDDAEKLFEHRDGVLYWNIGSFKTEQEAIDAVNRHGAACV